MSDDKYLLPPKPQPEEVERRPHGLTLLLSGGALVIAILAAVFSGWQAWEAHVARTAAERSAAAAEGSLKAFADSFRFDQRPSLSLVEYEADRSPDGTVRFSLNVGNVGKTEAFEIDRDISMALNNKLITRAPPVEAAMKSIPLGNHMYVRFEVEGRLSSDQWREVDTGHAKLSVRLIISLRDAFDSKLAPTGWCVEYIPGERNKWKPCVL